MEDFFEHIIKNYAGRDGNNNVALDIGANDGKYTKLLLPIYRYVFAFEAEARNFQKLKSEITSPKCFVIHSAVGVIDGKMKLYLSDSDNKHTLNEHVAVTKKDGLDLTKYVKVDSITLNTIGKIAKFNVDFVKCNIHGAENFIFDFGTDILQYHSPDIILKLYATTDSEKLSKTLSAYGYKFFDKENRQLDRLPQTEDVFFISKKGL